MFSVQPAWQYSQVLQVSLNLARGPLYMKTGYDMIILILICSIGINANRKPGPDISHIKEQ